MLSFVGFLFILFVVSLFCNESPSFEKGKMAPVKALLALLIVADHLTFQTDLQWIQPIRKWGAPIVALFFFISGYGLVKSYISSGEDYLKAFFQKRIWKVILPSLIAYALFLLICFKPHEFGEEIRLLVHNGIPLLPYSWFVEVIVLLYFGFWLSYRFVPEQLKLLFVIIWSCLLIIIPIAIGYDRCWWVGTLAFPTGMVYAKKEEWIHSKIFRSKTTYSICFAALVLFTALFYLIGNVYLYSICYVFIPLSLAIVLSYLPLQKLNKPVIVFLASISYEIYLCQGIAMDFLHGNIINIQNEYLYIVAVYVLVIIFAFITKRISSSIFKLKCR